LPLEMLEEQVGAYIAEAGPEGAGGCPDGPSAATRQL
jgi:hypothetical protein